MSVAAPGPSPNRSLMLVLIGVSALNPLAINMFVPAMPDMVRSLHTDLPSIQLVLSSYLFATAVGQLVIGPLSDRFGRRPVMIAGLAVFILASVACAVAPTVGVLIAARVVQGAGGCVGMVISRAVIRDLFDRDQAASALGYVTMGFAVAPMVGPTVGGILNDAFGWNSIFAAEAIFGAVSLLAALAAMPETRREPDAGEQRKGFLASVALLLRIPAFWAYALTLGSGVAVFFVFLGGAPIVASTLFGMSGTEFGLYFALGPGGYIVGNFLTTRFSRRFGIPLMMVIGTSTAVLGSVSLGVFFGLGWHHPLALFLPMGMVGLANGLSFANALAGAISLRPQYAGAASGLIGSLQVTGGAIASVLVGVLMGSTPSVFVIAALMITLALMSLAAALWSQSART